MLQLTLGYNPGILPIQILVWLMLFGASGNYDDAVLESFFRTIALYCSLKVSHVASNFLYLAGSMYVYKFVLIYAIYKLLQINLNVLPVQCAVDMFEVTT